MSTRQTRSASRRTSENLPASTNGRKQKGANGVKRELEDTPDVPSKRSRPSTAAGKSRGLSGIKTNPDPKVIKSAKRSTQLKKKTSIQKIEESEEGSVKEEEIEETIQEEEEVYKADKNGRIATKKSIKGKRKTHEEKILEMAALRPRSTGLRMLIGAHVSVNKGVQWAVKNSTHIGGNAFALFIRDSRRWNAAPLKEENRDMFKQFCVEDGYDASKCILPHGSYLVNLAEEDPEKAKRAYNTFLDDLQRCEQLGIKLYNFHPGARCKSDLPSSLSRIAKNITSALKATTSVTPVLETTADSGTTIGGPLNHFRDLFALIPESYHSRLGICIDTCHSFSAGYDIRTLQGWNSFMAEFDEKIGLKFLRAFHLNDSKKPLASRRDLHANIGTGFLGLRAFHSIMNDKRCEGMPMILETPISRRVEGEVEETTAGSEKKGTNGKEKKKKPPTVEDKSIWAEEIKLLESLIGMDAESKEFLDLEARLSEQGKSEREESQEQYDRKQETLAKAMEKRKKREAVQSKTKKEEKEKKESSDESESDASG